MTSYDDTIDWQGIALVTIGAFCFSTAILFTRLTDGLNVMNIAFFRAVFGFLFLCVLMIRFPEPVHVRAYRDVIGILVALGLTVSLTVVLYTYSIQNTTAANAALLVNSAPIYVAVLSPLLLHERTARYTGASLLLAITGIICVSNPAKLKLESSSLGGIVAGALSGFTYAIVMIEGRFLRGRVTSITQTMWSTGITALVLLPWAIRAEPPTVIHNIPYLIPLGIFSLGLSYLLYFVGLQRINAQIVSVVALFEPVSGVLIGLLAFQEVPNLLGIIGGLLILASIYLIAKP
jgi:drug/metabolite transporter (DMT)-like permease